MKLGIALAGGGARGAAQIGILQVLEENGIKGDMYSGTSAGSFVASAKALGYTNRHLVELLGQINTSFLDVNYRGVLKALFFGVESLDSLVKGTALKRFLNTNFNESIHNVRYPLGIITTDVNDGSQVIFASKDIPVDRSMDDLISVYSRETDIKLSDIIYASTAIPGIYPPFPYHQHTLVDGSIVNNLPVNTLKAMGADKVIGIDLNTNQGRRSTMGILKTITRSIEIMINQNEDLSLLYLKECMVIEPKLAGIGLLDFHRTEEAYEIGYRYGKSVMNQVYDFVYEDA